MTALLAFLTVGVNVLFWTAVGGLRSSGRLRPSGRRTSRTPVRPAQVAILVAAHDEEAGVTATVDGAHRLVPRGNVFVVSDGSSDRTVDLARRAGATVFDLHPNRGKAGALQAGIDEFALAERFAVVMLLDADTVPAPDYLETGLPLFDDAEVVAVAGRARTQWDAGERLGLLGQALRAHRERVYVAFQVLFKYGQAARRANAVTIVPGFASMYRTRILPSIDIAARGLAIEDFNMTFEVHARRLGRVEFHPGAAVAYTQDPTRVGDYSAQVGRWSLGFWQTVGRHDPRPTPFWIALAAFVGELLTSSLMFVLLPVAVLATALAEAWVHVIGTGNEPAVVALAVIEVLPPHVYVLGVLVPDYALTVLVAIGQRRPAYLWLGVFFLPLRCLDSALCLRALLRTWTAGSTGTWRSPTRRTLPPTVARRAIEAAPAPAGAATATGRHRSVAAHRAVEATPVLVGATPATGRHRRTS